MSFNLIMILIRANCFPHLLWLDIRFLCTMSSTLCSRPTLLHYCISTYVSSIHYCLMHCGSPVHQCLCEITHQCPGKTAHFYFNSTLTDHSCFLRILGDHDNPSPYESPLLETKSYVSPCNNLKELIVAIVNPI